MTCKYFVLWFESSAVEVNKKSLIDLGFKHSHVLRIMFTNRIFLILLLRKCCVCSIVYGIINLNKISSVYE